MAKKLAFLIQAGFLFILLFTTACASIKKTNLQSSSQKAQEGRELSVADERQMTEDVLPEILKDYPAFSNPVAQAYITKVGSGLIRALELDGAPYKYQFHLVTAKGEPVAFSLPAGEVFISASLLAQLESEAELAGVLARQVAHITLRHAATRIHQLQRVNKPWYTVGGGYIGGAMGYGIGKMADSSSLEAKYSFFGNTLEENLVADSLGFQSAVQAGYEARHVNGFLIRTLKSSEGRRLDDLRAMAEQKSLPRGRVTSNEFKKVRKIAQSSLKEQGRKTLYDVPEGY